MQLTVTLDFSFDGIDNCSEEEVKSHLINTLQTGAEATNSDVDDILVENESGTI